MEEKIEKSINTTEKVEKVNVAPTPRVRRPRASKKASGGPDGSVELIVSVPLDVKRKLELKLKSINEKTGKNLSFYTLLQYVISDANLNEAERVVLEKLREYEELEKKQKELGIFLV